MSDFKVQGAVEMSTDGVDRAFDRASAKAGQMAVNMAAAGAKAGKAVEQIGEMAEGAGEKFTKAESAVITSIKRLATEAAKAKDITEQLGNIEFNVAAKGLDANKFRPMLDVVRQLQAEYQGLETAQGRVAGSGRNFGAGLQNTSYQLQDFIVQVNGGTDATRALAMQLPQMLVGFGAAGAAIGVVAALLPNLISMFADSADEAKSFGDAMSDFESSLSDVGRTVKTFDMEGLYEQFNGSTAAVRAATIEQVKFQLAFIETQRLVAQKAFGKSLDDVAMYGDFDNMAGGVAIGGLARELGVAGTLARDLLPALKGLKSGTADVGEVFEQFGTSLLGGNAQAIELAKSLSMLAKGEKDAAAASAALNEAQAKMAGGHVTTKKEAEEAAKATKKLGDASQKAAEEAARNAAAYEALIDKLSGAALDEARKNVEDYNRAWADHLNGLDDQRKGLEEQIELYGLTATQIAAVNTRRAEETLDIARRTSGVGQAYIALLEREVELRRQIEQATGSLEARKNADDAAKAAAKEWKRTADSIEQSITDALMRGFESGEDFGENLKKTLTNMFKTLVLRPIVQPIAQGMAGAVMAPMGGIGFDGSGGSGGSFQMPTTGIGSSGMISGIAGSAMLGGTSVGAFGAGMASGLASWTTAGATVAGTAGAGAAAGGAVGAGMMVGAAIPIVGIALAILAAMDWGGGTPHAGAAVFAGPDGARSPRSWEETQAMYANPADANGFGARDFYRRREQGIADALTPIAEGAANILNDTLSAFGQEAQYKVGVAFSSDDDDKSRGRFSLINGAGDETSEFVRKYAKDPQQGFEQFAGDLGASLRDALVAADLPGWADEMLAKLGDKPTMDALGGMVEQIKALQAAAKAVGPALGLAEEAFVGVMQRVGGDALGAYVQTYYTDAERLALSTEQMTAAFGELDLAMPETKEGFRDLVESIDTSSEAGRDLYATLINLSPAFAGIADAAAQAVEQAAAQAAEEATRHAENVARERAGLETELLRAQGDTVEMRRRERAELDESNRAIYDQIRALEDQQEATRAAAAAQAEAQANVATAETDLRAAYEREASELRQTIDQFDAFARSLRQFREQLLVGRDSPLSASQRSSEVSRQFEDVARRAQLGDTAAIEELQGISSSYLDVSRDSAASAEDYYRSFARVQGVLQDTESVAERHSSIAQQQLDTLDAQVSSLITINESVLSVRDAILALNAARSSQAAVADQSMRGTLSGGVYHQNGTVTAPSGATVNTGDFVGEIDSARAATYLASNPDVAAAYAQSSWGMDPDEFAAVHYSLHGYLEGRRFAAGGFHSGGLRLVGEQGPELEVTGPSRIYSASQTRDLLGGGNAEMVRELRALREEVASLRAAGEATARNTHAQRRQLERWDGDGMPDVRAA